MYAPPFDESRLARGDKLRQEGSESGSWQFRENLGETMN
jgi:hypothetical protein